MKALLGLHRGLSLAAWALLMAGSLSGCGDLLQEPDTGIATLVTVTAVGGNGQTGAPGATLAQPLRVRLEAMNGASTERLRVEWVVVEGAGTVSPRNSFTDQDGIAETTWTLGPGPSRQRVVATFHGDSETFEAQLAGN